MPDPEISRKLLSNSYFGDNRANHRCMNVVASMIGKTLSEEEEPYVDESQIRTEFKRILEHKVRIVSNEFKVRVNQNNTKFNSALNAKLGERIATELDLHIIDSSENLIAAFELKALCSNNPSPVVDFYRDLQRLSLIKIVYPDALCVFVVGGFEKKIEEYYTNNCIPLPYKKNVSDKIETMLHKAIIEGSIFRIPNAITNNQYKLALDKFGVINLKIRKSRCPVSLGGHMYSYEVLEPENFQISHKIGEI